VGTAIHEHSARRARPFIKINCAAIPSELMESELFGHKKGSFTGAVSDKVGLMEAADGGSLLLDEIAEMPVTLQVKLLRVLQEREFRPVGSNRVIRPNFRLICATNLDVEKAMAEGKLREDLYFRINTVTLSIPPLRDRPEDVPLLAEHFMQVFRSRHNRAVEGIHPEAMRVLLRYRWPGNVRELEHVIERGVIVAEGPQVMTDDLSPVVNSSDRQPPSSTFTIPPHHTLAEIEKLAILQTLERTSGNKRKAAHILGVYRPTLYSKLRKYHLAGEPNGTSRPGSQKAKAAGAPQGAPQSDETPPPR
jgi:transcriptional regulator with PAS, ATPase and Fis domain